MYTGGYKNLTVWKKAIAFAGTVYEYTKPFPTSELYGLTSQMRRCAVSVASNIAEGCARQSNKEFIQFIAIANGSLAELLTQAIIARILAYYPKALTITCRMPVMKLEKC